MKPGRPTFIDRPIISNLAYQVLFIPSVLLLWAIDITVRDKLTIQILKYSFQALLLRFKQKAGRHAFNEANTTDRRLSRAHGACAVRARRLCKKRCKMPLRSDPWSWSYGQCNKKYLKIHCHNSRGCNRGFEVGGCRRCVCMCVSVCVDVSRVVCLMHRANLPEPPDSDDPGRLQTAMSGTRIGAAEHQRRGGGDRAAARGAGAASEQRSWD